jgi:hypothetical protein
VACHGGAISRLRNTSHQINHIVVSERFRRRVQSWLQGWGRVIRHRELQQTVMKVVKNRKKRHDEYFTKLKMWLIQYDVLVFVRSR